MLEPFVHDVRFAIRTLRRNPSFSLVAILTLSLGIGASAAIFTIAYGVLWRPLPYPNASALTLVKSRDRQTGRIVSGGFSGPDLKDWRERSTAFSSLALCSTEVFALETHDGLETIPGAAVSASFFDVLGRPVALGRPIAADDAREVVISARLWRERFGGDPAILGRVVHLNQRPYTVVGVARADLDLPTDAARSLGAPPVQPEIWAPLTLEPGANDRRVRSYRLLGLLAPGATRDRAQEDAARVVHRVAREHPEIPQNLDPVIVPLLDDLTGAVRPALTLLMGAVGLVLLVACADAANLFLARQAARKREIAVRMSLGAPASRLAFQIVAEAALIAGCGCLLGILIAKLTVAAIVHFDPIQVPRLSDVRIDWAALGFACATAAVATVLSAAAPVGRLLGAGPPMSLISARSGSAGRDTSLLRKAIVGTQLAVSVTLLVGATLLARSFVALLTTDIGVRADHLVTAELNVATGRSLDDAAQIQLVDRVLERLRAVPETVSVGAANGLPPNRSRMTFLFDMAGPRDSAPVSHRLTYLNPTPDYFKTLGIRLLDGRTFTAADNETSQRVAILSAGAARTLFGRTDVVGRSLPIGPKGSAVPIVGIVADVKYGGLDAAPNDMLYLPFAQRPFRNMTVVARTAGDPRIIENVLSRAIHEVDPAIMLGPVHTLDDIVGDAVAQPRFRTFALGALTALALVLAGLGLYGVVSYSVARRTAEIGVRLALGATPGAIRSMVIAEALALASAGSAAGLASAFVLSRYLRSILYGVAPTDPASFAFAAGLLALLAVIASCVPARRAMAVDPIVALRTE